MSIARPDSLQPQNLKCCNWSQLTLRTDQAMPRPPSGPRRIDSSGTWYAVKTFKGKRRYLSLQTKLKSEAMRRWPEAQAALEEDTRPPKFARGQLLPVTYYDPVAGSSERVTEWSDNLTNEDYLVDAANTTELTWSKAQAIAEKRFLRRRGKTVSKSWRYNLTNALRHLAVEYPLQTAPKDIRLMVDRMESLGYADTTIAIRTSAVGGVIDALIKGGYTEDDYTNPVDKVDTAAISTNHHHKATPEDYRSIGQFYDEDFYLAVIVFTGCRINEALKGDYSEQGWLKIGKDIAKNKASIREIPLPPQIVQRLKHEDSISDDAFRTRFNRIRPHDRLTPHSFRHGWKSAARLAGAEEITAERLLGHAVGKMNSVYGVFPREVLLREAQRVWGTIESWLDR